MTKPSHFSTSIKVIYLFHLLLTILSIGGILYLVFALRETQNELKDLKDMRALCDQQNTDKTESSGLNESPFDKDGSESSLVEGQENESKEKRVVRSESKNNQTCAKMILDVMKLLKVANKLIPNNTDRNQLKGAICLPGPAGPKGSQGIKGDRGFRGPRGDRGYRGRKGGIGEPGPRGIKGDAGDVMKSKDFPPKITTHPPKIIFIKEGVNLTLNCTAIGFPLPSVIWLKDNASLPGTHLFPERGKGLRLHFTNITYDRKGKYSCVATNSVGKASFDAKVIFQVPPKRLSSLETVVYKGNAVNLHCPVDSYPPAKIRWIKPGQTLSDAQVLMVNNRLNIEQVQKKHEGIYLCEGRNKFGSTFTALSVKVRSEVGPTFKEKPAVSKGSFRHQKVIVNCSATGDPVPTITWTKRDMKKNITQGTRAELTIPSFDTSDEGDYACTAENALGSKVVAAVSLYIIQCPRLIPPENGHLINLNKDSDDVVIFSCDPGTQMIGPEIRVCQRNATWSGTPTYCVGNILQKEGSLILNGQNESRASLLKFLKPIQSTIYSTWKLCYRASRDGWSAFNFHGACGDRESTVTIIKVGAYIFGGYSDVKFGVPVHNHYGYRSSTRDCHTSYKAFIFSLKNKDNLPSFKSSVYQNHHYAICADAKKGAVFGEDISIGDFARYNSESTSSLGYAYRPPIGYSYDEFKTKSLLAGSAMFSPDEIEVFFEE